MKRGPDRGGRRPLPPGVKRSERVVAFLRPADRAKLGAIARARGLEAGAVVREILERALRRSA